MFFFGNISTVIKNKSFLGCPRVSLNAPGSGAVILQWHEYSGTAASHAVVWEGEARSQRDATLQLVSPCPSLAYAEQTPLVKCVLEGAERVGGGGQGWSGAQPGQQIGRGPRVGRLRGGCHDESLNQADEGAAAVGGGS